MNKSLFGTDGIRNRVGTSPFTLQDLPRLAQAYAYWLSTRTDSPITVGIADDSRASASFIKATFKAALHAYGITTYDADILSTPALIALVQHEQSLQAGIMISASHNPHTDNGIKFISHLGKKISDTDEAQITALFTGTEISNPTYSSFGTDLAWYTAAELYQQIVSRHFPADFLRGLTIVLDCAHGATYQLAPALFELFGARIITINDAPNGSNINAACGSLHPTDLQKAVISHAADIGFAFDGDGDRVIAVNKHGMIKTGDDMLALLVHHPQYHTQAAVVGTIMSNQGLQQYLMRNNKQLIRTAVGDTHVLASLEEHNMLLGGEPSGHIITRNYLDAADGIVTALKVVETMIHIKNWNFETFTHFPQSLINIPVQQMRDLQDPTMQTIIEKHQSLLKQGRLIVRYSGTESVLRIMVEEEERTDAYTICQQLAQALHKELN